ncbi:MAG: undecaprenyl-diphosphate phosphatase [Desulfobacterium sp.]|nr:undecaprenyl-diphosphate phosphatase [Desulfobacterium sp.]
MELYQGLVLGVLQGLTEFLPVSSSGHLVLGQNFFGISEPALSFDVSVHIGTLVAVLVVFFEQIKAIFVSLGRLIRSAGSMDKIKQAVQEDGDVRFAALIIVGSIPTAIIGLILRNYVDLLFSSLVIVGSMLLVTGTFLWFTRLTPSGGKKVKEIRFRTAFFIGTCQGIAVIPGISRSGATIAAGLFSGVERETAARYSFLLSMPAIVGAELLMLKDSFATGIGFNFITLFSTLVAFIVGTLALVVLMRIVKKGRLHLFAPYCWALGAITIILGLVA